MVHAQQNFAKPMKYSVLITLEYLRLMISHERLKYSVLSMNLGAILGFLLCLKVWIKSVVIFKVPYNVPGTILDTLGPSIIVLIIPAGPPPEWNYHPALAGE